MPLDIAGSCRCGSVRFTCKSHTPVPYQRCYCSICRKTAGGGGYAINIGGIAATLRVDGQDHVGVFRAQLKDKNGKCALSSTQRRYCIACGSALWLFSPEWPELIHPFASAVNSELPKPPHRVHIMLKYAASWVHPHLDDGDDTFELYPDLSLEDWHRRHDAWVP